MRLPTLTSVALLATTVTASSALHRIEDQKHRARDTVGGVNTVVDNSAVVHNSTATNDNTVCKVVEDPATRNDTERLYNGFRDLKASWIDLLLLPKDLENPGGPKYLLAKCLDGVDLTKNTHQRLDPGMELHVPPHTGRSNNDTITIELTPIECQERVREDLKMFPDVKQEDGRVIITDRKYVSDDPQDNRQGLVISGFDEPRMNAFRAIATGDLNYNEQLQLTVKQIKDGSAGD